MKIGANIPSLQAYTAISRTNKKVDKSMLRISTGVRINSVSDDAAGMAISNKMKMQIKSLEMAERNSQDGISLVQTAEGALQEVHNMIQRIRELAVQASNDTMEDEDRKKSNLEIQGLLQEIDSISFKTEFNTIKLLNGGASRLTKFADPTDMAITETVFVSPGFPVGDLDYTITNAGLPAHSMTTPPVAITSLAAYEGQTLHINGIAAKVEPGETLVSFASKIKENCDTLNLDAKVLGGTWDDFYAGTHKLYIGTKEAGTDQKLNISGDKTVVPSLFVDLGFDVPDTILKEGTNAVIAPGATLKDSAGNTTNLLVVADGNRIHFYGDKNDELQLDLSVASIQDDGTFKLTDNTTVVASDLSTPATLGQLSAGVTSKLSVLDFGTLKLQIGANKDIEMEIDIPNLDISTLDITFLNIMTLDASQVALKKADHALSMVSDTRARLGAYQNRLEHTIASLDVTVENAYSSLSRIYDTDVAWEMTQLSTNNVIAQAGMAMLGQANQRPQQIIQLLG